MSCDNMFSKMPLNVVEILKDELTMGMCGVCGEYCMTEKRNEYVNFPTWHDHNVYKMREICYPCLEYLNMIKIEEILAGR